MAPSVALTGATGFIGRHLAIALTEAGYRVRALVRRDAPDLAARGIELRIGDLDSALDRFAADCAAVIHVAGAVRGRDARQFHAVNAQGSARVAEATPAGSLFLQVSSLAARLPGISPYAASKAAGETMALAHAGRLRVVVVRPPAVYGPEDRATLPLFRGLARGVLAHPAGRDARFSLLYADDLVHLVRDLLAAPPPGGTILEPDDGTPGGYGWSELAAIARERLGHPVRLVAMPRAPISIAAWLAERYGRVTGRPPILSHGKVAELYHRDWVSDTRAMAAVVGWRPMVRFGDGLAASLAWYRAAGWL
jgi:nucleoside-diphosphate-sugar epimerase